MLLLFVPCNLFFLFLIIISFKHRRVSYVNSEQGVVKIDEYIFISSIPEEHDIYLVITMYHLAVYRKTKSQ